MIIDNSFIVDTAFTEIFNDIFENILLDLDKNNINQLMKFLNVKHDYEVQNFLYDLITNPDYYSLLDKYEILKIYTKLSEIVRNSSTPENRFNSIKSVKERARISRILLECAEKNTNLLKDFTNASSTEENDKKLYENFLNTSLSSIVQFNKLFKNLFDYDRIFSRKKNGDTYRKRYRNCVGSIICPYCNFYEIASKGLHIDHNLPKCNFPLFSLSKFNLVPSCKMCNMDYKKDQFKIFNPLTVNNKFDEEYSYVLELKKKLQVGKEFQVDDFFIELVYDENNVLIEDSLKYLGLRDIYNMASGKSKQKYFLKMILSICEDETLKNLYKCLDIEGKPIIFNMLGLGVEEYNKKLYYYSSMSKFKQDILRQYKIKI